MPSPTSAIDLAKSLARQFAERAAEADQQARLPVEDVQALKDSGYLGLSVPAEFGGWGLSMRDCLAAHVELAQGSAATAMVAGMSMHIFGSARERNLWRDDAFEQLCWAVTREKAVVNSVASEPRMGSPSRGGLPASSAEPNGQGWLVNGHKTWTTGGRHLTHMLVKVRVGDDPGVVLVRQQMPGIRWVDTWSTALSLRASASHDVYFEDVVVPEDRLIARGSPAGPTAPNGWFPMVMSSIYLGSALAARDAVIKFALERVPSALGKPIATLPAIQRQIGEIDIALQAARALFFEVAAEWDGTLAAGKKVYPRIAAAKHQITGVALEVTDKTLQIAGGSSITKALPLERHFRDVRAGAMQPPSGDTALEIVGRSALGQ